MSKAVTRYLQVLREALQAGVSVERLMAVGIPLADIRQAQGTPYLN